MKNIKIIQAFLLFTGLSLTNLFAQQAVVSAGGDATGTGGSAAYTVGQVSYTSHSGADGSSNEGVQQPYEFYTIGIDQVKDIALELSVFPNPSLSKVTLKVGSQKTENLSFQLYDENAKLLTNQKITSVETIIPMENLANAIYFLSVKSKDAEIKNFKVIKHN